MKRHDVTIVLDRDSCGEVHPFPDMIERPTGEYVRFDDIPQPPVWVDQPDEPGFWWINDGIACRIIEMKRMDDGKIVTVVSECLTRSWIGKWQRIPTPTVE